MNDKVQIDAREILKKINTTPGDLTLKYTEHEWDSPVIDRFIDLLTRLNGTEPVFVVFLMNFKWNFKHLKSKSTFFFPSLRCENHTISCLFWFFIYKIFELYSLHNATESLTAGFSDSYGTPRQLWNAIPVLFSTFLIVEGVMW